MRASPQGLALHAWDGEWYGTMSVWAWDFRTGERLEPESEYLLELRLDQTLVVRAIDGERLLLAVSGLSDCRYW